jgi:tetratricopeptide (TPR) repeat protein
MQFVCVIGGSRADRDAAVRERSSAPPISAVPAATWPFIRAVLPADLPPQPVTIRIPDLHLAFPTGQISGTRLVLTQSTYQVQRWLDWLDAHPQVTVVADASADAMKAAAAELFVGRGPWSRTEVVRLEGDEADAAAPLEPAIALLRSAFQAADPASRLAIFEQALLEDEGNPALHLAVGSASMEVEDAPRAQRALDRALELAPDWEAAWFEYGKLWLRADDLERAADHFAEAARLMPTFAAALSNLGAALAETERPDEAIVALEAALRADPHGHPIQNNLSVIYREQGRLEDAIAASERVVELAPGFVFGHYNLAHALFLHGRFADASARYAEGQRRDPQKNPVQASRAAVAHAAAGDHARAVEELTALGSALTAEARAHIFEEAAAVLEAVAGLPGADVAGLTRVLEVVRGGGRS